MFVNAKMLQFMILFHQPFAGAGRRRRGELVRRAMSGSTNSTVAAELTVPVEQLPFVNDKHGGVIIEMVVPMDPGVFSASLKAALAKWREQVTPSTSVFTMCSFML